jgi:hypothetical protein
MQCDIVACWLVVRREIMALQGEERRSGRSGKEQVERQGREWAWGVGAAEGGAEHREQQGP